MTRFPFAPAARLLIRTAALASVIALAALSPVTTTAQQPSGGAPVEPPPEDIPVAPRATPVTPEEAAPTATAPAPSPAPAAPSPPAPAPPKPAPTAKAEVKRATEARVGFDGQANDPSKPVHVRIVSPRHGEVVQPATSQEPGKPINTVEILFEVENYTLAEFGNRLHVIIDNDAPVAVHDTRQPLVLKNMAEGGHLIRAFAVKADGRALGNPQSFALTSFYVGRKNFLNFVVPNTPLLTLNLPTSGVQDADDTSTVWLDFLTQNAPIGKGYMLRFRVNNQEDYVTDEKPSFWTGLKPGRYEFMAELVDSARRPVPGVFNRVTRTFDLRATHKATPLSPEEAAAAKPSATNATPVPRRKPAESD
ncbi:hypothetical protein DB346_24785 [Verrucomicrobia bacterium LW23]|nr:hypothetical protein DB346_24785 [Verrucomicrobia bacterium LW23]